MKISTFMPLTNAETRGDTYIQAIQSHLLFSDELIVVDGGSTDDTIKNIQALADPRIKIITRLWPQDSFSWTEFCKAWNAGLEAATGDWVVPGESDHIFHEDEIPRLKDEITREQTLGKAIITINKIQSSSIDHWRSKAKMYYFIHKAKYPQIKYGFDPHERTDLCQPIWHEGSTIEDIPAGEAVTQHSKKYGALIGGTGVTLWNYLWTFKTLDQVVVERTKAANAWNSFTGFSEIYKERFPTDPDKIRQWIISQLKNIYNVGPIRKPLNEHPKRMRALVEYKLRPPMIGALDPYQLK